jgi:hypothetical protein
MTREFEIRREVELPATPEEVWDAIATREGLAAWLFDQGAEPDAAGAEVWDRPRRLLIRIPPAADGATQAFEYVIEPRPGDRAVLRFVHSGFLGESWADELDFGELTGHGWDMYLFTLAEYLRHFRGRRATYVEAEAPPPSSRPDAWPALLDALGEPGDLAAGDRVRLTPDGMAPIEGVADYVAPHYLGVRTPDALIRFHGRSLIGMPIAVGLHLFDPGVDAAAAGDAWRAWLARVFP